MSEKSESRPSSMDFGWTRIATKLSLLLCAARRVSRLKSSSTTALRSTLALLNIMPASLLPALFPASAVGDRPVVVMDGGMGTTLQAPPFELGLDSALWRSASFIHCSLRARLTPCAISRYRNNPPDRNSSELLTTDEGKAKLTELHTLWINSGAEILGSCTYQSSIPLFLDPTSSSYTQDDIEKALKTMNAAMPVITSPSLPSVPRAPNGRAVAALSLGPFGAQVQPGQEYAGLYPAPYGRHPSPAKISYTDAAQAACPLQLEWIGETNDREEDHLAAWHLQRLEDFAKEPAFEKMGILAFETTPLVREARAIRRAMDMFDLAREGEGMRQKPFYIAFVFPAAEEGRPLLPDKDLERLTLEEQAKQVVEATFGEREGSAMPAAIGINCTNPLNLEKVIDALAKGMEETVAEREERPWLVLCEFPLSL